MKRSTFMWRLGIILLLGLAWTPPVLAERRTALVIGNAAYGELGVLRNPVNDATDLAAALRQLHFDVTLLRDANLRAFQEAVETFVRQLRQGGVGLFYYAGHGIQVQGENYLIPLGARINREQDVAYEAVPVGRILGGMEDAGNPLNLIILDACRDNPYARQWRSVQRGLAVVQAARGSLIAYATAPGSVARDGMGRNGVYTAHLLQYLSQPGLSIEHLFKRVRVRVVEATQGQQIPWESSSLTGDFFFVPSASSPSLSPATPLSLPSSAGTQVAVGAYPQPAQTLPATIVSNDGATMVLVPEGEFTMGTTSEAIAQFLRTYSEVKREWFEDETPVHRVFLDAFYLDQFEVTNTQFQQFVQVTGYRTQAEQEGYSWIYSGQNKVDRVSGASWRAPRGIDSNLSGLERHPVVQVSWQDAKMYCSWAEKRLPTEAEWEKAARGVDGRLYPWGSQLDGARVNFCDRHCKESWRDRKADDGYQYTAPVGTYEGGKSPYGVYDMSGNVWEWVSDWYDKNYYQNSPGRNPQGAASGAENVLRGGSWDRSGFAVRAADRRRNAPGFRNDTIGMRCAKSP